MMKKIAIFLLLMISFPFSIYALELNCPSIATQGEDIVCSLKEDKIIGLKVKYQVDSVFSYEKLNVVSPWKQYYAGVKGFSIGNIEESIGLEGELHFKIGLDAVNGESYFIRLTEIEEVDLNNQVILLDDVSNSIQIVSDINTLDSLEVSTGKLSPKFDKNVNKYWLNVYRYSCKD